MRVRNAKGDGGVYVSLFNVAYFPLVFQNKCNGEEDTRKRKGRNGFFSPGGGEYRERLWA